MIIGLEKIKRASAISFICYLVILPICAYVIGIIYDIELLGIVISYLICYSFGAVATSIMVCYFDFERICKDYSLASELKVDSKNIESDT